MIYTCVYVTILDPLKAGSNESSGKIMGDSRDIGMGLGRRDLDIICIYFNDTYI